MEDLISIKINKLKEIQNLLHIPKKNQCRKKQKILKNFEKKIKNNKKNFENKIIIFVQI
jgi:hypothetical protein